MELTNLVVNPTARNIMQQFGTDIEKAHQVGDEHPNGKWVWTKLPSGRFDWRVKKNASGAQGAEGGQKGSGQEESKEKQPKDERFSEEGIVGKDGGFNKQGKTYKRWAALREKVESGKATPEEKKEFAHLHNQYLNEKDRHAYEQSKQTDPKAKEPKYKTVDERREEYKAKSGKGTEQKENEEKKAVSPEAKKLIEDKKHNYAVYVANAQTHMVLSCDTELAHMLADGVSPDSAVYKSAVVKSVMDNITDNDLMAVANAVEKYGVDAVKEAMLSEKGNTVLYKGKLVDDSGIIPEIADAIILAAQRKAASSRITETGQKKMKDYLDVLDIIDKVKVKEREFTEVADKAEDAAREELGMSYDEWMEPGLDEAVKKTKELGYSDIDDVPNNLYNSELKPIFDKWREKVVKTVEKHQKKLGLDKIKEEKRKLEKQESEDKGYRNLTLRLDDAAKELYIWGRDHKKDAAIPEFKEAYDKARKWYKDALKDYD